MSKKDGSVRRYIALIIVALALLLWATLQLMNARGGLVVEARNNQNINPATQPPGAPAAPAARAASPDASATPEPPPNYSLDCSGCHGAGKTLPYLAGALFHTRAHNAYTQGFHAKAVQGGRKAANCLDCHAQNGDMTTMLPASNPNSSINRANLGITCGKCHGDAKIMGNSISNRPFVSYQESVHARAISRGNFSAAVCTDCHNSHDILPASDSRSPIFKANIPLTCGKCHSGISVEFNQSVHGEAVARGVSRSPSCTDCHGIHSINSPVEPGTSQATQAMATETCAQCHEGVALTKEFGVPGQRVSSYQDSYHGLASRFGSKVVANCASCHGVHNILPSSNPRSMISANNITQTCGQCHPGATQNFATGRVHLNTPASQDMGTIGTTWVRRIYLPLIFIIIGGMVAHNLLVWRKKAADKRKLMRRTIVRLTLNQRVQHWLLLVSFILLVVSGFALEYPDSWLSRMLGSSEPLRRFLHRLAAVVMMVVGLYHIGYLALTREGRSWLKDMLPGVKDIKDVLQNFAYYLGFKVRKPKIARFGYAEKAEYWAVVWGTVIMGLTGLMMWFKISWFGFLPRWWIDIALAIHFYEAVLATLAIIVWHFYQVIFDPDVYPINWAFYDGRESDELYKEEHELDYERMMKRREEVKEEEVRGEEETAQPGEDGESPAPAVDKPEIAPEREAKNEEEKNKEEK
jgi:formate dehydrogenase gamma subunit